MSLFVKRLAYYAALGAFPQRLFCTLFYALTIPHILPCHPTEMIPTIVITGFILFPKCSFPIFFPSFYYTQ